MGHGISGRIRLRRFGPNRTANPDFPFPGARTTKTRGEVRVFGGRMMNGCGRQVGAQTSKVTAVAKLRATGLFSSRSWLSMKEIPKLFPRASRTKMLLNKAA